MLGNFACKFGNIDDVHRQIPPAGIATRQHQQTIDQQSQPVDFFEHAADDFTVRIFVAPAAQADLTHAANGRKRRPQLVRCVGGEAAHLLE